jgi:Fe2+ transport system protein B
MVPREDAEKLAKELRCPYIETSAKEDKNIPNVFDFVLEQIENQLNPENPKTGQCWLM